MPGQPGKVVTMSIRKYFVPKLEDMWVSIRNDGFSSLDKYKKAEALVGDSRSIWLIESYCDVQAPAHPLLKKVIDDKRESEFATELVELQKLMPDVPHKDLIITVYKHMYLNVPGII